MSVWKYVVFQIELPDGITQELPILFPAELVHQTVAEAIHISDLLSDPEENSDKPLVEGMQCAVRDDDVKMRNFKWRNPKPIAAGFIGALRVDNVGGISETLKLKSRPTDKKLINCFQFLHGLSEES